MSQPWASLYYKDKAQTPVFVFKPYRFQGVARVVTAGLPARCHTAHLVLRHGKGFSTHVRDGETRSSTAV